MSNRDIYRWSLACGALLGFVTLGELAILFREFVFDRLGIGRNLLLVILWLVPVGAAFLVVRYSERQSIMAGLSLIPVLSLLGPLVHLFFGELGATVDLKGIESLRVTVPVYFLLSSLTVGIGSIAGFLFHVQRT